jgi:hypothetical protein
MITTEGDTVTVTHLTLADAVLAGLLTRVDPAEREALVTRALAVGARGLASMGIDLGLDAVDARVSRSVERATDEAAEAVKAMLAEAQRAMVASLDPEQRSSLISRAVADFNDWRERFLSGIDPDAGGSHTHRLLAHLHELLGPGGPLEQRLNSALDPTADGSGLARVSDLIDKRFAEIRDLLAEQRGRVEEAARGAAKGFDYEDRVEAALRELSRPLGALVERTSLSPGALSGEAKVGDFVVDLGNGSGVVVEAKNVGRIALKGKGGMLEELDRAIANRQAHAAICVSAGDAFPDEVGVFGVYGNKILVVDDGDGTMLGIALRWALAFLVTTETSHDAVDLAAVEDRLARIGRLASRFSATKRTLTGIAESVEKVRDSLDDMRRELIEAVDTAASALRRGSDPGSVVEMRQAG